MSALVFLLTLVRPSDRLHARPFLPCPGPGELARPRLSRPRAPRRRRGRRRFVAASSAAWRRWRRRSGSRSRSWCSCSSSRRCRPRSASAPRPSVWSAGATSRSGSRPSWRNPAPGWIATADYGSRASWPSMDPAPERVQQVDERQRYLFDTGGPRRDGIARASGAPQGAERPDQIPAMLRVDRAD